MKKTESEGKRTFTGNFAVLLNHNNHNADVRFSKRQAKRQLTAYLKGHQTYVSGRDANGNYLMSVTPQKFI